uniref:Uncharacterized protein n=1 Tax=Arundo donax TaxID=35708 RepID=A0A0A9AJT1_ARUDO
MIRSSSVPRWFSKLKTIRQYICWHLLY